MGGVCGRYNTYPVGLGFLLMPYGFHEVLDLEESREVIYELLAV